MTAAMISHATAISFMLAISHDYIAMRGDRGFLYMSELDISLQFSRPLLHGADVVEDCRYECTVECSVGGRKHLIHGGEGERNCLIGCMAALPRSWRWR